MPEEQVKPARAEIRCNNKDDEHVQLFIEKFKEKELEHEVIVDLKQRDIDIKFFDAIDTLIDHIGLPHKG